MAEKLLLLTSTKITRDKLIAKQALRPWHREFAASESKQAPPALASIAYRN